MLARPSLLSVWFDSRFIEEVVYYFTCYGKFPNVQRCSLTRTDGGFAASMLGES